MLRLSTIRQHYKQGFKSVVELVEELEQQIEALTLSQQSPSHIVHLQQTIAAQQYEIQSLRETVENKSRQIFEIHQLNHRLQMRIRELESILLHPDSPETKKDSHNSSLPPSLDPPWSKPKRTRSLRKQSGLKVGGQIGHPGSTLRQIADPDLVIFHQVKVCQHCHYSLIPVESIKFHKRQIFEIENGRLTVIEHRVEVKRCRACQKITKALFPANLKAPAQYGSTVFSRIVYLNLYQLLPVARTAESMQDLFNCPISWATVQRAARFCSDKLIRSEQRIKAAIRDSLVAGVDETGIRINGENNWVHLTRTDSLTHLAAHSKRGKTAMDEIGILNQFKGTLVRDGWFSYNWYQQCQHSLCNAHLLRDLTFIEEAYPEQQKWTADFASLLLEIKEAVETARANFQPQLEGALQTNFLFRYDAILVKAEKSIRGSPTEKRYSLNAQSLLKRLTKNKTDILRFMFDFSVPFDNNGSERDLRMIKLQQKISGCFRTFEGVKAFCRIRSYLSSVRKQGRGLLVAIESALRSKPISLTN